MNTPQVQGQILIPTPLVGKEAFTTWFHITKKPGDTLWLKQGSKRFCVGTVGQSGELTLYATRGSGENRIKTYQIQKPYEFLAYLCQEQDGGAFCIPGNPQEFPMKKYCYKTDDIAAEMDDGTPQEQWQRIEKLAVICGLTPGTIITSGGKSYHPHYFTNVKVPTAKAIFYKRMVAILLRSDPAAVRPAQAMRAPGFFRKEKGNEQALVYHSEAQYSPEDFEAGLKRAFESEGFLWHDQKNFSDQIWCKISRILRNNDISDEEKRARIAFALQEEEKPASVAGQGFKKEFTGTYNSSGAVLPIEKFLSRRHQDMVQGGAGEGNRNNGGFALACDLIGVAQDCNRLGIQVQGDPRQIFEDFAAKCSPAIPQQEVESLWNSASSRNPSANIKDDGLLARASYLDPKGYQKPENQGSAETAASADGTLQWLAPYKERVKLTHEALRSVAGYNRLIQTSKHIELNNKELFDNGVLDLKYLKQGTFGLQVALGGGKSHLLRQVIKSFPSGNVFTFINAIAISTSHHPDVAGKLHYIWDIKNIQNADKQRDAWQDAKNGWMCGCIESIEDFVEKPVMILEEVEQIRRSLLLSSTCRRDRKKRLETFKRHYRAAKWIFLADADVSGSTLKWLRAIDPTKEIRVIQNTARRFEWQCYFYTGSVETQEDGTEKLKPNDKARFEQDLINDVARGKKLLIASDSQRWCESIERTIKEVNPKANILRVDSTTKSADCKKKRQQVSDFLSNPDKWIEKNQPDYVIYSPTCLASLDISIQDYFDAVFGCFFHANFLGCKQMLGRLRTNAPRHIFAKTYVGSEDNVGSRSPLPQVVAKHMFQYNFETIKAIALEENPIAQNDFQIMQKVLEHLDPESSTYKNPDLQALVEILAHDNYSRGNLRQLLAEELDRCGHIVTMLEPDDHGLSSQTSKQREEVIAEWAKAISEAPVIDYEEAERIQRDQNSTMSQRYSVMKSKLQFRLPDFDLNPEFVAECHLNDRGWVSRQEVRFLLDHPEIAKELDQDTWKFGLLADDAFWDLRSYTLKIKALNTLGILEIARKSRERGKNWNAHSPSVLAFRKLAFEHRDLVKLALNINVTMESDPCYLLRRCLRAAGYKTTGSQRKVTAEDIEKGSKIKVGDRARFYRVDPKVFAGSGDYANAYKAIEKRIQSKLSKPENGSQTDLSNTLNNPVCDHSQPIQPLGYEDAGQLVEARKKTDDYYSAPPELKINDWVVINQPGTPHHRQLAHITAINGNFLTVDYYKGGAKKVELLIYEVDRYQDTA